MGPENHNLLWLASAILGPKTSIGREDDSDKGPGRPPPPTPPIKLREGGPLEGVKLMYIKLPMYLLFYMTLGLNYFDVGKSVTWAIGRGGLCNLDFFLALLVAISGPKKVSISGPTPSNGSCLPASMSIRPAPCKQQVD